MANLFAFSNTEIVAFALVLLRVIGFVVTMPVLGMSSVPVSVKILLSFLMTFVLFPQVGWQKITADIESLTLITLAVKEVFVGLCFGFIARLFFHALSMTAQIMSISLGLSAAQLLDPNMGESSTAIDQFYIVIGTLFFLAIQGHHSLIRGFFETYQMVPLATHAINSDVYLSFARIVQLVMAVAVKLSAPVLVTILFMNIAIAVMGRAVPQINILITSLPINILSGLFVMFIGLPLLIWQMSELLNLTAEELMTFFKAI